MKKRIYYLIGIFIILFINYLIKEYLVQSRTIDINNINIYEVVSETFRPIIIFLLMGLFSSRKPRAIVVAGVLAFLMVIDIIIRYTSDKELIEYNELIGLLIGLTLLFAFEWFENKQTNKNEKQATD